MQALLVIYKLVNQVLTKELTCVLPDSDEEVTIVFPDSDEDVTTIVLPDHKDIKKDELSEAKFHIYKIDFKNNILGFKNIDEKSDESLTIDLSDEWKTSGKNYWEAFFNYLWNDPIKKKVKQFTYQKGSSIVTFDKDCSFDLNDEESTLTLEGKISNT